MVTGTNDNATRRLVGISELPILDKACGFTRTPILPTFVLLLLAIAILPAPAYVLEYNPSKAVVAGLLSAPIVAWLIFESQLRSACLPGVLFIYRPAWFSFS